MARPKKAPATTDPKTETPETEVKKVAKKAAPKKLTEEQKAAMLLEPNWIYYDVMFKLRRPMLGTNTEVSMMEPHVLKKAQDAIKIANKLTGRLTKVTEEWRGAEFTDDKMVAEIKAIISHFAELSGYYVDEYPEDKDKLLELAHLVEEHYKDILTKKQQKANIFLKEKRDGKMWPKISTHMILGNLKANARVITNNGDKSIFDTKVAISEDLSLSVKAVEPFMLTSQDVERNEDGSIRLYERPIRVNRGRGEESIIGISEQLPVDTEFGCTLRVRRRSCMTEQALWKLFDLGKNQGFGAWRGSGNMGAYSFKLKRLEDDYREPCPPGHEGWD